MSNNSHTAHHLAVLLRSNVLGPASKAKSSNTGRMVRPAATLAVVSALMLGMGAPAQASATDSQTSPANAAALDPAAVFAPIAAGVVPTSSYYEVQPGDTLGLIASKHRVSLDTIFALNGLNMASIIYPGQRISITGAAPSPAVPNATVSPAPTGNLESSMEVEIPASSINAAIVASAWAQLGAVQDCTVLAERALQTAGIGGVGDESPESLLRFATPVATPQPGDLIYYANGGTGFSHNAIYIGDGMAIHSGWNGDQTIVFSVNVGSGPSYYRVHG